MVRVLAVADEEVPTAESRVRGLDVDVLFAAGDLPWDYLELLADLLAVPAVFVPGNHDPDTDTDAAPEGFCSADGHVVEVAGLRVAGLGGCVRYNDGPHQYTQEEYRARTRRLVAEGRGGVDVLLTHTPAAGVGDETDPAHRGIDALHDAIAGLTPSWHLHGHIHPYGLRKASHRVGNTTVLNVIPWTVLEVEPRDAGPAAPPSDDTAEVEDRHGE
ncbi:metallophosphoesterase [Aeromicrobium phragmitis]|uniref:Metallophosphoesterase n=1 Tax=Aeromicrobium phragmitis TaxID=2478914 RepID=A0A3L8PKE6_9ACTN|nr:metallophosphoesterase [Aeromicrobium phragmitis]RLV55193.1 metallophosphoesterase [Aeromicrobium phragmitis]